jgi:hypothetical protein
MTLSLFLARFPPSGEFSFSSSAIHFPRLVAQFVGFAISTYDTDHVLVQEHNLQSAIHALREAGHTLHTDS